MFRHFKFLSLIQLSIIIIVSLILYSAETASARENPVVKAAAAARPSVVNIRGEKELYSEEVSDQPVRRVKGMGTGVIIDSRGYIVTNYHVIDSVKEIQVTTADGKSYTARPVARDQATDLAIIKIDSDIPFQTISVGNSQTLEIGETVIAMGNAYGYEHTVTMGIVSALHRTVQASDVQTYENLIQTDASINPGNSGGPLLNIDGEMVGINAAVRAGAQGIGFAIPVDAALETAADLLQRQSGEMVHHGLTVAAVCLPDGRRAVKVEKVEQNSPAAKVGIHQGDLIRSVDGVTVRNRVDFACALVECSGESAIKMEIVRDNEPYKFALKLQNPSGISQDDLAIWNTMGLQLQTIESSEFTKVYGNQYRGGLKVVRVRLGSPASEQGIEPGDVLIGLHKWETVSMENVMFVLTHADRNSFSPLKFLIIRNKSVLYGNMNLPQETSVELVAK